MSTISVTPQLSKLEKALYSGLKSQMLSQQLTFSEAVAELAKDPDEVTSGLLEKIIAFHQHEIQQIERMKDPISLVDRGCPEWYAGPGEDSLRWAGLRRYMLEEKKWPQHTVDAIDGSSTRVLSLFCDPAIKHFKAKGLVLGYVQSGKTANFTAVMSKAADEGYRLFIVLAGLTNSLRQQTQERMLADLVDRDRDNWMTWTDAVHDFEPTTFKASSLLTAPQQRHLIVVKKNASRLRKLIGELEDAGPKLKGIPTLIIDDECDQASVNASGSPDDPSTINLLTRNLIEVLPRVTYAGYTATPYANVLIDPGYPEDLYPRNFITGLPKPRSYFGAEELFGRALLLGEAPPEDGEPEEGYDMVRLIPEEEEPMLRPARADERHGFMPQVTPSLRQAVMYYLIATAVRQARGQFGHSTMLVHTTMYAQTHINATVSMEALLAEIRSSLTGGSLEAEMKAVWEYERLRVDPGHFGLELIGWPEVMAQMPRVLDEVHVVVENGLSDVRVDYASSPGRRYIVIGGNILARGLTLEGLVVSFFLRTSSQYDTLMQMGRWFGYRNGWEDLPRIWMTPQMKIYFRDMATVEAELRRDISRYDERGITPTTLATRIRTHPTMQVTARNKMLAARKVNISFSGCSKQTTRFRVSDREWLESNWRAAADLVDSRIRLDGVEVNDRGSSKLLEGVEAGAVIEFLRRYRVHADHADIQTGLLIEYIQRQIQHAASLLRWNVGIVGSGSGNESSKPLGHLGPIKMVRRTRLDGTPDEAADVGALLTKADAWLDMEGAFPSKWADILEARNGAPPLLLLYPMDPNSKPTASQSQRRPLSACAEVMGVAVLFPEAPSHTAGEYIAVELGQPVESEQVEYTPEIDD